MEEVDKECSAKNNSSIVDESFLGRFLSVILTIFIGVLLSAALFIIMQSWEERRLRDDFSQKATIYTSILRRGISRNQGLLRSLGAFKSSCCEISEGKTKEFAGEFKDFTSCSFSCHTEVKMLGWVVRVRDPARELYAEIARNAAHPDFMITERTADGELVRAGKRDEYFPVFFMEPLRGMKNFQGLIL